MTSSGQEPATDVPALKAIASREIDARASDLERIGRAIFGMPELGFKEHRTSALVREQLDRLGLAHRDGIAITGVRADIACGSPGPTVALIGELDSLLCWEHPDRDPATGAVHACGHNAQIATVLGAAAALLKVAPHLSGTIAIMAVPAEEYVEIEERLRLRDEGKIEFLGGKAEFARLGAFDDVDMAIMIHSSVSPDDGPLAVGGTNNGMVAKFVRYLGRASHAGGAPDKGVNALYAAHVAISGLNAIRETFRDEDHVRVHPIVTRGGDVVSAIPADVRLELFVRGASIEAIDVARRRVDRALKAGALALGAEVEITTLAGYLPLRHDPNLQRVFRSNAEAIVGAAQVTTKPHGSGSTDMGDVSHFLPALHPYARGAAGAAHGADYQITDYTLSVVNPAKALALTVIDLLCDGAVEAKKVTAEFAPLMTIETYLAHMRGLTGKHRWSAAELEGTTS